ncbi:uncharacterized protein Z518_02177 [Rhinocladiella mackenziei CBS 650.93]|uniref:Uncharacterized protein n=1 Tax=Rhinocladiella mackenziei CBS 650.93 TaxID=1442369 RepID=A0A0D2IP01_9EURO|nr:uncharacterized protein Z518_02177 [Rhinocladiella mackenziei CBS 650.93]KIX07524.1 hypothetical protein Z518_02177 [Rhinocladiella mackenziei CBS 650.93]
MDKKGSNMKVPDVPDSALLIRGSNGQMFAALQSDPTFSGTPTQPPSVDPLPRSTTTSGELIVPTL